jgi:hypothetical protein
MAHVGRRRHVAMMHDEATLRGYSAWEATSGHGARRGKQWGFSNPSPGRGTTGGSPLPRMTSTAVLSCVRPRWWPSPACNLDGSRSCARRGPRRASGDGHGSRRSDGLLPARRRTGISAWPGFGPTGLGLAWLFSFFKKKSIFCVGWEQISYFWYRVNCIG